MENDFSPPMPYTLGYNATSKSTDSFKGTEDSRFKFQTTYFLRFIFQACRDSGFKFEIDGIRDSDLGLQGPANWGEDGSLGGGGGYNFSCIIWYANTEGVDFQCE